MANATFQDGVEFLKLASETPVRAHIVRYPLEQASKALKAMKKSSIDGAGVLIP